MKKLFILLFTLSVILFASCDFNTEPVQNSVLLRNKTDYTVVVHIMGDDYDEQYTLKVNQQVEIENLWTNKEYEVEVTAFLVSSYCEKKISPNYYGKKEYTLYYSTYSKFWLSDY